MTASTSDSGNFSPAAFDELKTRAQRDGALLDSSRRQLEAVQRELASEKARSQADQAELSRRLESEQAQRAELQSVIEEIEAERDTYREDVDGWRERCADLERKMTIERTRADEEVRLKLSLAAKVKRLTAQLEAAGLSVQDHDLASAEESLPRISPVSPVLTTNGQMGYFPHMPPPEQTVKLLSDMRQQIFNLAGTLEFERRQRVDVEQQLNKLQSSPDSPAAPSDEDDEDHHHQTTAEEQEAQYADASAVQASSTVSPGRNRPNRHVFAYDSSAGSMGQSSASLGSQSLSMTTMSENTSDEEALAKAQAAVRTVVVADEDEEDDAGDFSLATGRGALQTLDEEEEDALSDALTADVPRSEDAPTPVRPSIDLEGGAGGEADESEPAGLGYELNGFHSSVPIVAIDGRPLDLTSPRSSEGRPTPLLQEQIHGYHDSDESSFSSQGPVSPPNGHAYEAEAEEELEDEWRPEFVTDWSFHRAAERALRKTSGPSRKHVRIASGEDFFGIMHDQSLPPLPVSTDALDMPPIYVPPASAPFETTTRASMSDSSDGGHRSLMSTDSTSSYLSRATGLFTSRALSSLGGFKSAPAATSTFTAPSRVAHAARNDSVASSTGSSHNGRKYVARNASTRLFPSPIADLDFTYVTGGAGSHPVFAL